LLGTQDYLHIVQAFFFFCKLSEALNSRKFRKPSLALASSQLAGGRTTALASFSLCTGIAREQHGTHAEGTLHSRKEQCFYAE
jgi:hypothetical protein